MKKTFKFLIGFVIGGICLYYSFRNFDLNTLKNAICEAAYFYLIPFVFLYLLNQALRTYRWRIFLSPLANITAVSLLPVLLFGFFMNTILPARGGEFVRAYLIQRRFNLNSVSAFGSIIAERISDLIGLFALVMFCSPILPLYKLPIKDFGFVLLIGIAFVSGAFLFQKFFIKKVKTENKILVFIMNLLTRAIEGFQILKSFKKIILVIGFSLMIWINEALIVFFVARFMHLDLTVLHSTAVIVGLSIGVMIPGAPGFIGTYEFFGKQMLEFLGYPSAQSLNFVLVLHFLQIIAVSSAGVISFFYLKRQASQVLSRWN